MQQAAEIFHASPPTAAPDAFIHRDFHPGNVLWQQGKVTGVVDWQSASTGPAVMDVGHCRVNLFRYGLDAADQFTASWEELTGARYHPWADIITIIGFLDGIRDERPSDHAALEEALARAVTELSPGHLG